MHKKLFLLSIFVAAILTLGQFAAADYTLTNGTSETVWVVYSRWLPANNNWPEGWRTEGYYKVAPGQTEVLTVPQRSTWVYIRVENADGEVKPPNHATRDSFRFWIHPSKAFTVVETDEGDFLRSNRVKSSLRLTDLYKYRNRASHTITNVRGQEVSLASRVFDKHGKTLQRENTRSVLPAVLESLKDPKTQPFLNPETINLVVSNPNLLRRFVPDIDPKFVTLLKRDAALRAVLRDPLVQKLLQKPAAIDELAGLLRIGGSTLEVTPEPNRAAHQNLPDLPAQQIYKEAINSVVLIHAGDVTGNWTGSAVLIDKRRKLVVTNQHVTDGAEYVDVVFPYARQPGQPIRDENFYLAERNIRWLMDEGYVTRGRVIRENRRNDLAIIQLAQIPTTAREIKHDFSRNVEDSMRKGDKVHILGNPGERLWNWTQGTFQRPYQVCDLADGTSLVGCLEMEADVHSGNSGGPVLNGQGVLIGIITAGTEDTGGLASPAKNIKALLNSVPAILPAIPPQQVYPKRTFRVINNTGVTVPYEIKWSNSDNWQSSSLETGFVITHQSRGQNVPSSYPKIRFDHIAGDQSVTYRTYTLETAQFRENNNDSAPTYRFEYNQRGDRLDLYQDGFASPTLSTVTSKETSLLSNYPNPFNPETWIPYQLAKPADVTLTIYSVNGTLVRTLELGHQPAGIYQSKTRAAYWDGRNEVEEPVASGLYFYTLKAGDFTATRKMLIRK